MDSGTDRLKCRKWWEGELHVVCRGWIQQIGVEFRICWCKAAVLVCLAPIISTESRTTWVMLSHMKEVLIRATWCIAAILTHKDFRPSLAVGILLVDTMNLPHVGLQRATLCESFLTQLTFVGTNTCRRRKCK